MIGAIILGSLASTGVLGTAYIATKRRLGQEPIEAIVHFLQENQENEMLNNKLKEKEISLEKKEKSLDDREKILDNKYQYLVQEDQIVQQQLKQSQEIKAKQAKDWEALQQAPMPKQGQDPVEELVKRNATARTGAKGYYRYLHDNRNALKDAQYFHYQDILQRLNEEFSNSENKVYALNLFTFLCGNGYNPYLISWIIMISLHDA